MRKFKSFVRRFQHYKVIYNIMLLDKQYQDMQTNHKLIMFIREQENALETMMKQLNQQMDLMLLTDRSFKGQS